MTQSWTLAYSGSGGSSPSAAGGAGGIGCHEALPAVRACGLPRPPDAGGPPGAAWAARWMAASARSRAASIRAGVRAGVPGPQVEQGRAVAGRQQQRGSPLDGRDVGGLQDQPPLAGDLLAGAAVADADRPDGHVVVADEDGDVAGEPGRVDAGADQLPGRRAPQGRHPLGTPDRVALLIALQDGDRDHAPAAEVGVQVGQVARCGRCSRPRPASRPWAGPGARRPARRGAARRAWWCRSARRSAGRPLTGIR